MSNSLTVLIVEDEAIIRDLLETALTEAGYEVELAQNSGDALSTLDRRGEQLRALVTDINLGAGTVTGWDIAKRAREIRPDLPVVYTTGDSGHEWSARGVPNSVLVTKPFAPAQITTAVSQLLNTSETPKLSGEP